MLEPYVWYDPHEIIKKLEAETYKLKKYHHSEMLNIISDLRTATLSVITYADHPAWKP